MFYSMMIRESPCFTQWLSVKAYLLMNDDSRKPLFYSMIISEDSVLLNDD